MDEPEPKWIERSCACSFASIESPLPLFSSCSAKEYRCRYDVNFTTRQLHTVAGFGPILSTKQYVVGLITEYTGHTEHMSVVSICLKCEPLATVIARAASILGHGCEPPPPLALEDRIANRATPHRG
jgi:hypothetical protein